MPDPTDHILKQLRAGDTAPFRELFETHRPAMRAAFLAMGACGDDADDLTQDVFVSAVAGISGLRDRDKLASWLFGIVRNRRLQYLREARRRATQPIEGERLASERPGPLARSLDAERQLAVQGVVTQLEPNARELLRLRYGVGLSYKQIAAELGTSVDNVGIRLHRLSRRLRSTLSGWSATE